MNEKQQFQEVAAWVDGTGKITPSAAIWLRDLVLQFNALRDRVGIIEGEGSLYLGSRRLWFAGGWLVLS